MWLREKKQCISFWLPSRKHMFMHVCVNLLPNRCPLQQPYLFLNNPSHLSCVIRYLLIMLLITELEIHMVIQTELLVTIRFALMKLPTKYVIIRVHFFCIHMKKKCFILQFRFTILSYAACEAPLVLPLGGFTYGEKSLFVINDWHASLVSVYAPTI